MRRAADGDRLRAGPVVALSRAEVVGRRADYAFAGRVPIGLGSEPPPDEWLPWWTMCLTVFSAIFLPSSFVVL
jgi:hypothetical protein